MATNAGSTSPSAATTRASAGLRTAQQRHRAALAAGAVDLPPDAPPRLGGGDEPVGVAAHERQVQRGLRVRVGHQRRTVRDEVAALERGRASTSRFPQGFEPEVDARGRRALERGDDLLVDRGGDVGAPEEHEDEPSLELVERVWRYRERRDDRRRVRRHVDAVGAAVHCCQLVLDSRLPTEAHRLDPMGDGGDVAAIDDPVAQHQQRADERDRDGRRRSGRSPRRDR